MYTTHLMLGMRRELTMATTRKCMAIVMVITCLGSVDSSSSSCYDVSSPYFNRSCSPKDFVFGVASASYQYEGAVEEGGRTPSIWDTFTHKFPGRNDFVNGDVAVDFYHRYKNDIQLVKELNMDAFRLSISWSRILHNTEGVIRVNKKGVEFYNNLINELVENGLQVSATLFHWDLPQALEDKYGGFLSRRIVRDFERFAEVCFEEFGDRVKIWATFNEPKVFSAAGYDRGIKAPGRCSGWVNPNCQAGDSATEPYIVSHNLLLAHAAAVRRFRNCEKCKKINAKIGMVFSPSWFLPYNSRSPADHQAAQRAIDFEYGWHLHPLTYGDYPESMKRNVGHRLPRFTKKQSQYIRGSYDYVGINYYSSYYAANVEQVEPTRQRYLTDQHLEYKKHDSDGIPLGPQAASESIIVYDKGIRKIVNYTKHHYSNPVMYIMENGYDDFNDATLPLELALKDTQRKEYHQTHIRTLLKAINEDGANVKGYFAWSLLDNFEWQLGYSVRFGLYYVDFKDNLRRYPKDSARWFRKFLSRPSMLFRKVLPEGSLANKQSIHISS